MDNHLEQMVLAISEIWEAVGRFEDVMKKMPVAVPRFTVAHLKLLGRKVESMLLESDAGTKTTTTASTEPCMQDAPPVTQNTNLTSPATASSGLSIQTRTPARPDGQDAPPVTQNRASVTREEEITSSEARRSGTQPTTSATRNYRPPLVVDIQFLVVDKDQRLQEKVVKEFAAVELGSGVDGRLCRRYHHFMLKSPADEWPAVAPNNYLRRKFHGISWDDGDEDVDRFRWDAWDLLSGRDVYVKGREKADCLLRLFGLLNPSRVITLDDLDNLQKFRESANQTRCKFHSGNGKAGYVCALATADLLAGALWKSQKLQRKATKIE